MLDSEFRASYSFISVLSGKFASYSVCLAPGVLNYMLSVVGSVEFIRFVSSLSAFNLLLLALQRLFSALLFCAFPFVFSRYGGNMAVAMRTI